MWSSRLRSPSTPKAQLVKDEERIVSNALVTYAAKLITGSIGFLMVPFLIRSLGEETYGVMGVCWSILGFMLLVELGIRPAVMRQFTSALFKDEVDRSNEVASTAFAFYLLISSVIVGVLVITGDRFLDSMNVPAELAGDAYYTLVLVGASASFGLLGVPFTSAIFSQLRHDIEHYVLVAKSMTTAILIVALFTLRDPRLLAWALVDSFATVSVFLAFVWQAKRLCPSLEVAPRHVTRRGFADVAGFGTYTTLIGAAAWINMQSGPVVISYFLGTAAVAHFTPILGVMGTLTPIQTAFLAPLRTFITKAHATDDWGVIGRVLIRSTRYSLLSTGAIVTLLASVAGPFVGVWLGANFEDTAQVLLIWCVGWLFQASTGASYGIYVGTARLRVLTLVNTIIAIVSISIGVFLVARSDWGVVGIAWGMLAAQVVRSTTFFFYSSSICQVDKLEYLKQGFFGPGVALLALGASSLGIQHALTLHPFAELVAAATGGGAVFALLAWRVGLPADDHRRVQSYIDKIRTRISKGRGAAG